MNPIINLSYRIKLNGQENTDYHDFRFHSSDGGDDVSLFQAYRTVFFETRIILNSIYSNKSFWDLKIREWNNIKEVGRYYITQTTFNTEPIQYQVAVHNILQFDHEVSNLVTRINHVFKRVTPSEKTIVNDIIQFFIEKLRNPQQSPNIEEIVYEFNKKGLSTKIDLESKVNHNYKEFYNLLDSISNSAKEYVEKYDVLIQYSMIILKCISHSNLRSSRWIERLENVTSLALMTFDIKNLINYLNIFLRSTKIIKYTETFEMKLTFSEEKNGNIISKDQDKCGLFYMKNSEISESIIDFHDKIGKVFKRSCIGIGIYGNDSNILFAISGTREYCGTRYKKEDTSEEFENLITGLTKYIKQSIGKVEIQQASLDDETRRYHVIPELIDHVDSINVLIKKEIVDDDYYGKYFSNNFIELGSDHRLLELMNGEKDWTKYIPVLKHSGPYNHYNCCEQKIVSQFMLRYGKNKGETLKLFIARQPCFKCSCMLSVINSKDNPKILITPNSGIKGIEMETEDDMYLINMRNKSLF